MDDPDHNYLPESQLNSQLRLQQYKTEHVNIAEGPFKQTSILSTFTLNYRFIMITGPSNKKNDNINDNSIEIINLLVISLLDNS